MVGVASISLSRSRTLWTRARQLARQGRSDPASTRRTVAGGPSPAHAHQRPCPVRPCPARSTPSSTRLLDHRWFRGDPSPLVVRVRPRTLTCGNTPRAATEQGTGIVGPSRGGYPTRESPQWGRAGFPEGSTVPDEDRQLDLAARIGDGQPVDWDALTNSGDVDPELAVSLRVLEDVAVFHRDTIFAAPAPESAV